MKILRSIRPADFKRWLKNRPNDLFGCGDENCPLHDWLEKDMDLETLDDLPARCSRFVGRWDALWDPADQIRNNGGRAINVLDHITS